MNTRKCISSREIQVTSSLHANLVPPSLGSNIMNTTCDISGRETRSTTSLLANLVPPYLGSNIRIGALYQVEKLGQPLPYMPINSTIPTQEVSTNDAVYFNYIMAREIEEKRVCMFC